MCCVRVQSLCRAKCDELCSTRFSCFLPSASLSGSLSFFFFATDSITFSLEVSTVLNMASRKIPEHVARELKRHVAISSNSKKDNKSTNVLIGCIALTSLAASFPYLSSKWIGNLNEKDGALTAAQVRRGAFLNSGTRDVGKDPRWDFSTGTYKRDEEFSEMMKQNDPNQIEHGDEMVRKRR